MTRRFDLDRPISLSPHSSLKRRAEAEILVLPERAIRLGGSGPQILRLCDGTRSGQEVVEAMRERYPSDPEIEAEIIGFLEEMYAIGGLILGSAGTPGASR